MSYTEVTEKKWKQTKKEFPKKEYKIKQKSKQKQQGKKHIHKQRYTKTEEFFIVTDYHFKTCTLTECSLKG